MTDVCERMCEDDKDFIGALCEIARALKDGRYRGGENDPWKDGEIRIDAPRRFAVYAAGVSDDG